MKYINGRTFNESTYEDETKKELGDRTNILISKVIESAIITFINSDECWKANET